MTTLVVGASGATGSKLVERLIKSGQEVKIIVRSTASLPESWKNNEKVIIIHANILDISAPEMSELVKDCQAIVSCLGHNPSLKGIFGNPHRLVTDAVQKLCEAITANKPKIPVRFVLMNTIGNRNLDLTEPISLSEKIVIGLLRLLLPPQIDNEQAAEYLRTEVGQRDHFIEWVAVRPVGLIDEEEVSDYELYPSPIRSAIFDATKISRINVAHFMTQLITNNERWISWKGQMPVIYNKDK